MNKSDYDKYYKKGGTYVIPVEIFNELFNELERQISNYEQALEDLDKKENIIKEVREKIEGVRIYGLRSGKTLIATLLNDILEILDKENKE